MGVQAGEVRGSVRMAPRDAGPATWLWSSCILFFPCRFIYELEHFNGVAELLEILGR